MTIYYIVNARMPTERAHGVNIAHMCAVLGEAGHDVVLVVPRRLGARGNLFETYGVPKSFSIVRLPVIDLLPLRLPGAFILETLTFALSALAWLAAKKSGGVVYTRGEMPLFLAPLMPRRFALVWETHIKPSNPARYRAAARRAALVIAATKRYAQELPALLHITSDRVLYEPDAVDLRAFGAPTDRDVARTALGLPQDKTLVVYTGSPQSWKGVDVLERAALLLPASFETIFVGEYHAKGLQADGRRRYAGYEPHVRIPLYLAAADILVLTADAGSETARHYTSPLKMFEYMAAGKPIVATDVPSFRDILSDETARFVPGSDDGALAEAIRALAADAAAGAALARHAREAVEPYSWVQRAARIIERLERIS